MNPVAATHLHGSHRLRPSAAGVEARLALLGLMMKARLRAGVAGGEAVAVGTGAALEPDDRLCAPRRFVGAHLAADLYERYPRRVGAASSAPDLVTIAAGMALAPGERDGAVATIASEDALGTDAWTTALRLVRELAAPLVLVVDRVVPHGRPLTQAPPPGSLPLIGEAVDGAHLEDVLDAVAAACERTRSGGGPAVVLCVRRGAPSEAPFAARLDPIERYARSLLGAGAPRERIEAALR